MKTRKKTQNFQVMGEEEETEILDLDVMGEGPAETTAQDRFAAQVLGVFQKDPEFDRAREEANAELIQLVAQYLTDYPSQRFGQALNNLGLLYNAPMAEPQDQLKRAKKILRRMKR